MWKAGQTVTIKARCGDNIVCRVRKARNSLAKEYGDDQRETYCLQDKLPQKHFLVTNHAVYGFRMPLY